MKNPARITLSLLPRNRSGWIEIVEAFVSILLIAGVILIIVNNNGNDEDFSYQVYQVQISILREIQTNDTLRTEIASASEPLPISWEESRFPTNLKNKIIERTPSYLECVGKICTTTEVCSLGEVKEKDIYSQFVTITATIEAGEVYRRLNLFCWTK
jgi:hypothetical protein